MPGLRLDQLLSRYGHCSRREAADWLRGGRVTDRDGTPLLNTAQRADPEEVRIDGQPVEFPDRLVVMLHKPAGCACSHNPAESPLIYDLLPPRWLRRNPGPVSVGRLDRETTGLLLITDDGALAHRLTSPKHEIEKTYEVTVSAPLPDGLAELLASGTLLLRGETKPCLPARLEITGPLTARLFLREGKYHQVRRMLASQGCPVTALHRSAIGELTLNGLPEGQWRDCRELLDRLH
ncbi:MAG: rRNA pseudouridine synthase [Verrucomicrobiales bacterium]|nr:rRNA pseudouridine synthase [Verrucomicrobiales bacterium]